MREIKRTNNFEMHTKKSLFAQKLSFIMFIKIVASDKSLLKIQIFFVASFFPRCHHIFRIFGVVGAVSHVSIVVCLKH
jgi:hypothetical protein